MPPGHTDHGWITVTFRVIAGVGLIYMVLPIVLMFPLSMEPGQMLRFPPQGFSLHWYSDYFADGAWLASTLVSLKVALGATAIATVFGTLAATGLSRTSPAFRATALAILMSPIVLPTLLLAVAIYGMFATLHLVGTVTGLMAAHAVLTMPFVVLNVSTALSTVPRAFEEAASSLGANPVNTFLYVTLPLASRGIAAGAVLAFLVSFDDVVIVLFLSGVDATTLPKRMLDGVFYEMTPMLAAVSSLLIAVNIVLILVALLLTNSRLRSR
jgi:putative spermidine/putrescine transport system permease protein